MVGMGTIRTFASVHQALSRAYLYPDPSTLQGSPLNTSPGGQHGQQAAASNDTFVFQYFPETLSDSQSANYNSIDVPGGSHPIVQWINNGPRTLSFQAQFAHEQIDPDLTQNQTSKHNVDIDAAVARLRFFMYPHYEKRGEILTSPPPILYLVIGKTKLRHNSRSGASGVPVVMNDIAVNYAAWHADGTPRQANVDFTFQEVVQSPSKGVRFVDREDFRPVMRSYRAPVTQSRRAVAAPN